MAGVFHQPPQWPGELSGLPLLFLSALSLVLQRVLFILDQLSRIDNTKTMITLLLIAATLGVGSPGDSICLVDHVDRIETNFVYDEYGRPLFCQRIFWSWERCRGKSQWVIVAWRLVKDSRTKDDAEHRAAWQEHWNGYCSRFPAFSEKWREVQGKPYLGKWRDDIKLPERLGATYLLIFHDNGHLRKIYTPIATVTHTQTDRERDNHIVLDEDYRKGLEDPPDSPETPLEAIGRVIERILPFAR